MPVVGHHLVIGKSSENRAHEERERFSLVQVQSTHNPFISNNCDVQNLIFVLHGQNFQLLLLLRG